MSRASFGFARLPRCCAHVNKDTVHADIGNSASTLKGISLPSAARHPASLRRHRQPRSLPEPWHLERHGCSTEKRRPAMGTGWERLELRIALGIVDSTQVRLSVRCDSVGSDWQQIKRPTSAGSTRPLRHRPLLWTHTFEALHGSLGSSGETVSFTNRSVADDFGLTPCSCQSRSARCQS